MPNYGSLRKLLPFLKKEVPAIAPVERSLVPLEQEANSLAPFIQEPEVIGQGTSRAINRDLPIVEADTLSPLLKDVDLSTIPSEQLERYKNWLKIGGAGAGAFAAANMIPSVENEASKASVNPSVSAPSSPPEAKPIAIKEPEKKQAVATTTPSISKKTPPPEAKEPISEPSFPSSGDEFSTEKLRQLQEQSNRARSLTGLARGMTAATHTMAGIKDNKFDAGFADQEKEAAQLPDQYVKQLESQKFDPNSAASRQARELYKQMGGTPNPNASAADLEKLNPTLEKMMANRESIASRKELAKQHSNDLKLKWAQLAVAKKELETAKTEAMLEKDRQKMGQTVNFDKQARGNAAQVRGLVQMGDRIDTLIDSLPKKANGDPDLSKLTPINKNELIGTFDVLLKGKSTLGGQKELMHSADTLYSHIAQMQQFLSGNKAYTNEGQLMKSIADTVRREKGYALEKVKDMAYEGSIAFKRLREQDPEGYKEILQKQSEIYPEDLALREAGFRAYDINKLLNSGYSKEELLDAVKQGKKPSELKSKMDQPISKKVPKSTTSPEVPSKKQLIKKGYNSKTNQTQLIYSDGSKETVDGRQ